MNRTIFSSRQHPQIVDRILYALLSVAYRFMSAKEIWKSNFRVTDFKKSQSPLSQPHHYHNHFSLWNHAWFFSQKFIFSELGCENRIFYDKLAHFNCTWQRSETPWPFPTPRLNIDRERRGIPTVNNHILYVCLEKLKICPKCSRRAKLCAIGRYIFSSKKAGAFWAFINPAMPWLMTVSNVYSPYRSIC